MSFTIICDKCENKIKITGDKEKVFDLNGINIDVTEDCGFQGCTVESIDITCWKCDHEVNI